VVTLMGNPSARGGILMRNAVNRGQLSTVVRIEGQTYYQIDASVNPGWSGGPVIDAEGRVIAVVAMKVADKAVDDIRGAMGRLDQDFRLRVGKMGYKVGITYGIPVSTLSKVIESPRLRDRSRQAEDNDKCAAKTAVDRLGFLAGVAHLRMQINVPKQIRQEADAFKSHHSSGHADVVALLPERDAAKLDALLRSTSVHSMENLFRARIDERVEMLTGSAYLAEAIKRDLKNVARKVREATKYAERPSGTYLTFSSKVKGYAHDFKDLFKRLEANLKDLDP
jgi:hypothetical protein